MGRVNWKGILLPGEPEHHRNPNGAIIVDGQEVANTLQCGHCGAHWIPVRGSKRIRGFCHMCNSVLCGKSSCLKECIPFEKRLDIKEGTRKPDAVSVAVPGPNRTR
jgi:hypothetical protein